ncbi:hypothetical protein J4204_06220 [Candidatus Woesearchaeota archaeon]|nr:hypothetical protein [Candidatus Woesearchaeota archaeon]
MDIKTLEKEFKEKVEELYPEWLGGRQPSKNTGETGKKFEDYFLKFIKEHNLIPFTYKIWQRIRIGDSKKIFDFVISNIDYVPNSKNSDDILAVIEVRLYATYGYDNSVTYYLGRRDTIKKQNPKIHFFHVDYTNELGYHKKVMKKFKERGINSIDLKDYYLFNIYENDGHKFSYEVHKLNSTGDFERFINNLTKILK